MRPLIFLDLDDVLCLNSPYGGYDVVQLPWPEDLPAKLWHVPALEVFRSVVDETEPHIVVTSSWQRLMELPSLAEVFRRTGAGWISDALHPQGEALQLAGKTRLDAIDGWLVKHHLGEPYVILDDALSGTGLRGSRHDKAGRLVFCDVEVGLQPRHAQEIRRALASGADAPRATG